MNRSVPSSRLPLATVLTLLTIVIASAAHAEAWLDAGDSALRHDLQYLVDTRVIDLPVTAWPVPSVDVARALHAVTNREALTPGQRTSLSRLERRLSIFENDATRMTMHTSAAAKPMLLRTFEDTPREEAEVGATLSKSGERFSARLAAQLVADPDDDKRARLDGSYVSARAGNWLLTAGALDRWWGAGWDGSLQLSNNARPVPALALDRESSAPFESRWLSWIGPWRLTTFMGVMEEHRQDRDRPLLFGMRVTFRPLGDVHLGSVRPFNGLEVGLERTAQWCAEGLPCNAKIFRNLLLGKDNAGETVDPEDEPGNQLAGWTVRWTSPIGDLPYALYRQKTGESINENFPKPHRSMALYGAEVWGSRSSGLTWRAHAEFAGTSCGDLNYNDPFPVFDCTYTQSFFNIEGYRYRGRVMGHSADNDARVYSLGLLVNTPEAHTVSVLLRHAYLNRGGNVPDFNNTVSAVPKKLWNAELGYQLPLISGSLSLGFGFDHTTEVLTRENHRVVRGFAAYVHEF